MKHLSRLALAAFLACAPLPALHAQLAPGDTVRLHDVSGHETEGAWLSRDSSTLFLRSLTGADTLRVAVADVALAEVLRGQQRGGWRAFGQTMAIGVAISTAVTIAILRNPHGGANDVVGPIALTVGGAGTLVTSLVAAIRARRSHQNWHLVDLETLYVPSDADR